MRTACLLVLLSASGCAAFSSAPSLLAPRASLPTRTTREVSRPRFTLTLQDKKCNKPENLVPPATSFYNPPAPLARADKTQLQSGKNAPAPVNKMLVGFYFAAWYALNVGYNIYVKKTLNVLPLPFTFAVIQLGAGILWLAPQWLSGVRGIPEPSPENFKSLSQVAIFHGLGQLATVMSMSLGSVSFVNVVKALEPIFTAIIGVMVTGVALPWQVSASMIPVCAGVALASVSELSFTWGCFLCAMASNVVYATRAVLSKISMDGGNPGKNMDPANTFAVVTLISFFYCIPIALILEGSKIGAGLAAVKAAGWSNMKLAQMVAATGLLYYTYNEMAFLVLGSVAPITQSVGNTIKRVVVIVAASIVFHTPMTSMGILGSSVAIGGVLVYSIVKGMFPDKPKKV